MAIFRYFLRLSVSFQISMTSMIYYVKIKFELVDKLNLILTNIALYVQHYFTAISNSPTGFNQTI